MPDMLEGLAAGLVATAPMTWTMWAADRWTPPHDRRHLPPQQITDELLDRSGLDAKVDRPQRAVLANAAHYAFGAAAGGVLGLAVNKSPLPKPLTGALVGTLVWAGSYLGWLPALGLRRTAARDYAGRNAQMIAAHLVWGAVAGALLEGVDRLSVDRR
jgi:putative membrane protein